ncbi:hypothetical protein H310_10666 [Aphanomyces invadans]|uniref:MATE efflux family protein n=1 Tax=Aphanomyces invadans TaxID=157072 RepID=A0A024TPR9_9STRA|nr:hypothetical protein H310_10666 [Aphanomyces invadans]ETV96013.1 hypothetical protein H310_10666 [Aphanomyces invadans]|eukprot:XP_008875324.1 hypothetical protein H310_10666 [Aphanomyces invadans]
MVNVASEKASLLPGGPTTSEAIRPLGPELRELASMAVQISLRQMVRQVMTITDAAFQGHVGTKQLAGVALAMGWMGVPSGFVQMSIQAISTLCSQAHGAGNNHLVGTWLQTAIVFAVVAGIPVMIWYQFVGHMIAWTMGDPETVEFGAAFARVMSLGLIPQYVYGALSTYFSTQGVIMPATLCSAVTMLVNIGFNQVFIYGAFGWDGIGFLGSPLATVVSTVLQLTLFVLYTIVWKGYHVKYWGGWSWECVHADRLRAFFALALPMGASSVVDWGSGTLAGSFSGLLGSTVAAAQAILLGLFGVVNSCVFGFSAASQIRMARYLGQGKPENAKRVLRLGLTIVLSCSAVLCLVLGLFSRSLFRIWSTDPAILNTCTSATLAFVGCVLVAFVRFLLTAAMNALARADLNLIANNIASWGVYVPLSYVLPIVCHWGLAGFWWADTAGETLKALILLWGLSRVQWLEASVNAQKFAQQVDPVAEEELEVDVAAVGGLTLSPKAALLSPRPTGQDHAMT